MRAKTQQGQQQVQKHIKYDEIGLKHKKKKPWNLFFSEILIRRLKMSLNRLKNQPILKKWDQNPKIRRKIT